jgi:putative hydrolase of the HAD superfamily
MARADLFFDLDRTLWDFDRNSREALGQIYTHHTLDSLPTRSSASPSLSAFVTAYEAANDWCWSEYRAGRMSQEELRPRRFKMALEQMGVEATDAGLASLSAQLGEDYVALSPHLPHLMPGALEVVRTLAERGHRLFILTNGFSSVQHIKMEKSGLKPFFESVIASDVVGFPKPDVRVFQASLLQTGSSAERAVMIGDDLMCDVVGARQAGWRQVHYNPEGHRHKEQIWRTISHLDRLLDLPL